MTKADIDLVFQKATDKFSGHFPRIISDNEPQFISKDFKNFVQITRTSHVRTSLYCPQSNGKLELFHKSIKSECIQKEPMLSIKDVRKVNERYINVYTSKGFKTQLDGLILFDKLREEELGIFEQCDKKLEIAREKRKVERRWECLQTACFI